MYYEINGEGKNLLLIHGLSANHTMFYHQVNVLKRNFKCILIDLPGFGNSKKEKIPDTLKEISENIFKTLKKIKIEKTNILGYSLGGTIALNMLKLKPDMVEKVIASNTLYNWYEDFYSKLMLSIFKFSLSSNFLKENMRKLYGKLEYSSLKKRELEKMVEMFKDAPVSSIREYLNILKNMKDDETFPQNEKILFLAGKKDKIAPLRKMYKLHLKNPHSKFKIIEDGDHAMCVSFWKEYNKIVKDFLI